MGRDHWSPKKLRDAARLLADAADHLNVSYPYSDTRPEPLSLKAVKAMIEAAVQFIREAQPEEP